jgi:prepilin-type N-terminal cleavage/methylation domain-containing protein
MKKIKGLREGFNLIELLVVMAIIAVLVGILIYTINAARLQQRNTQRRGIINTTKAALEAYYAKYKDYPPTPTGATVTNLLAAVPPAGLSTFATGMGAADREDPLGAANNTRMCYARVNRSQYKLYVNTEPAANVACNTTITGTWGTAGPVGSEFFNVQ